MVTNCEIKQQNAIQTFLNTEQPAPYADSPYYEKIEPLFKQYQNSVSAVSTRELDNQLLVSNTAALNRFFANEVVSNPNFASLYPDLFTRLETMPLVTPAEVQTVIDSSFLTLELFPNYLIPYNPTIPTLFDDYYSPGKFGKSGMKSFCSLVPNIFGAYTELMNAFNDIKMFAGKITSILSAIQDFSLAGLLEMLKKQALQVIDSIVQSVLAKVSAITGLFTRISNFRFNTNNVYSKMISEKQKIDEVLSKPSIDNLKSAIEGAIAFASSLFESLNIEEIQFLILRFCELIGGLENFFDNLIKPIQDIPNNFRQSFNFLKAANFGAAARSSAAGAFRLPSEQRAAAAAQIDSIPPTVVGGDGVQFGDEGFTIAGGIAVRRRAYRIEPITPEEMDVINNQMTFEQVKNGTSYVKLLLGQSYAIDGPKIWTNVRDTEKVMLYRLSKKLGKMLTVNSAYRSSYAQSIISGKDPGSWHISGQAFDVRMSSFSGMSLTQFEAIARSIGFSRVRPYHGEGFVHIDTGPASQTW